MEQIVDRERTAEGTVTGESPQSYSPDVVASYVWDAIREVPGVADLYRNPLQALGEKVHLERRGPVRLEEREGRHVLDVHLVVRPGAVIPALAEQVRAAATTYLKTMTGIELDDVHIFVDDLAVESAPGA
jgi:uncharacterized alkaline shock family protein YloU